MLFTDLGELKAALEIPAGNKREDKKLLLFAGWASEWLAEALGRADTFGLKERTEFYSGTGTMLLPLKARPVYASPAVQVWEDKDGAWGAASGAFASATALTYGTDFTLKVDDGSTLSRSGLLVRLGGTWEKRWYREAGRLSPFLGPSRGSIKVTYTGGYTADTLPGPLREAAVFLIAKMRHVLPLGVELTSESYEERSISWSPNQKSYLMGLIRPLIEPYRNRKW